MTRMLGVVSPQIIGQEITMLSEVEQEAAVGLTTDLMVDSEAITEVGVHIFSIM